MGAIPQSSQDVVLIAQPTGPRGFPGPAAPTYASITAVRGENLTGIPTIYVAGYYGIGTPGGGLFTLVPGAGADNGGTIIHDSAGNSYVRQNPTWSVAEWGAKSDVTYVSSAGTIAIGTNQFLFPVSAAPITDPTGKRIVIAGAGTGSTTLASTIQSYNGLTRIATLADNAGASVPVWWARNDRAIDNIGVGGYNVGDLYLMNDGTTVGIKTVNGSNQVTSFLVIQQGGAIASQPPTQASQVSSPSGGGGTGLIVEINYTKMGQFAYGSDDGAIVNAMIAANPPVISLMPGTILGTTAPIAANQNELRWQGQGSNLGSTIIPLADLGSGSALYQGTLQNGGGANDIFFNAFKLADSTVSLDGVRNQVWTNILARNGRVQDIVVGPSANLSPGQVMSDIFVGTDYTVFGDATKDCNYNFNNLNSNNIRVDFLKTQGGKISSLNQQGGGARFNNGNMSGGGGPFLTPHTIECGATCVLIGNTVSNGYESFIHVNAGGVQVIGVESQAQQILVSPTTNTVRIEAFRPDYVVTGISSGGAVPSSQSVAQVGTASTTGYVGGNADTTYVYPPLATPSPTVLYAQSATNLYAVAALANGGAPLGQYFFNAIDAFLTEIGSSRLALMDILYFLAAPDEGSALINLANPSGLTLTKHGVLNLTAYRGYVGDGTSGYLDSGLNTNTLTNYILNNASMAVWTGSPSVSANSSNSIGTSGGGRALINPRQANGNMATRSQSNAGSDIVASSSDSIGGFAWSRNSSTLPGYTQYVDGLPVAHPATAATTIFEGTVTLLADGTGTGSPQFSTRPIAAAMVGTGFSDSDMLVIDQAVKNMLRAAQNAPT